MLGSVAIALFLRVMGTALWLLFTVIVARGLTVEDFGFVFFVINVIMTGGVIIVLGYDVTAMRFGSRFWRDNNKQAFRNILAEARSCIAIAGLIACFTLCIAVRLGLDTPVTQDLNIALLTGISMTAVGFMSVERDILRAANKLQDALFAFSVIRALVPMILSAIALGLELLSSQAVLLFYCLALLSALVWDRWRLGKLKLPTPVALGVPHLKVALETWPGNAAFIIFQRAPTIVIGLAGGLESAALFIAAERVSQLSTFLSDAVRTAVGPGLAKADTLDESQQATSYASLLMLLSGSVGTVLLLILGWGILWLFGPDYRGAFVPLMILLLGQLSWTVMGPTGLVLNMMGHNKIRSLIGSISAVILMVLLPFVDTVIGTAWIVTFVSWGMNVALWLAIKLRLNLTSGVFGLAFNTATEMLAKDWQNIRTKITKLRGRK
ncbi:hypothetical protein Q4560_15725 [Celeribacter halophilus]|uniref:hypothetical protein n=1 Tax=Celeribacter halophilus TaxID=576117 RepID=UPI0026E1E358|nr:hypothetical protein [Celeribacter halophilus]MDO6724721.1 hypothetical protein [Celeribacter halophilus]